MSTHSAAAPAPRSTVALRRVAAIVSRNATTIVAGVVLLLLVVPPVFTVIYSSFVAGDNVWEGSRTLDHYRNVLGTAANFDIIFNSVVFAAGSAVLSVGAAAVVAFFVERTNAPFRGLVYLTAIVSLGVPVVVQTMGWLLLIGPNQSVANTLLAKVFGPETAVDVYTLPAMIFVQATIVFPAMFLLVAPAFRLADPSLEHAGAVSGASRLRVTRTITLPLVTPSILAATLLAFIVGLESFEVPALIGTPAQIGTLATAIYAAVNSTHNPDFGAAAAFSTLLMAFTLAGLYLYQRVTSRAHRYVTVTGKGYRPDRLDLLRWRWPAGLVTLLVPLTVVAPILILLWASMLRYYAAPSLDFVSELTLMNYRAVLDEPAFVDAAKNTLVLGVLTGAIVMLLSVVVAWAVIRRRNGLSRGVDQLGTLPLVVPGVVLSLAMLRVFINFPLPVYNTIWIILIAFVVHYVPYGLRYGHAGMITLHSELEEAADVSGASRFRVFRSIVLPLLAPTIIAGGLFVLMATIRQLSLVIFLSGPDLNVVSSWVWYIWNNGALGNASSAAMLVLVPVIFVAFLFYRLTASSRGGSAGTLGV